MSAWRRLTTGTYRRGENVVEALVVPDYIIISCASKRRREIDKYAMPLFVKLIILEEAQCLHLSAKARKWEFNRRRSSSSPKHACVARRRRAAGGEAKL